MTEPGSDELLSALGDSAQVGAGVRAQETSSAAEEERLRATSPAEDEPGEAYPDPDQGPPPDESHDEYDPLPPAA